MKLSRKWLISLVLLPLLALTGCSDTSQPSSTARQLVYALPNEIVTLDPIKAIDTYTVQVIGQVFEGLVGLDASNRVMPLLAERWTISDAGDVWTFYLRQGVWFHSSDLFGQTKSRQMTAEDVRFSFERLLRKDAAQAFALTDIVEGATAYQSGEQDRVSGIRVVDDHTIQFKLIRSERTFINRITSPWFPVIARESVESEGFGQEQLIGTGPYRLLSRIDTEVVLARHDRYWRETPGNVANLRFVVLGNEQLRMTELENGRVDVIQLSPAQAAAVYKSGVSRGRVLKDSLVGRFKASSFETFNIHLIGFNAAKLDQALRRAISYAIDRQSLVDGVASGTAVVAPGPIPRGMPGYTPAFTLDIHDSGRAAEELARSGYRDHPRSLELLVHGQAASEQTGILVQSQLAKQGIEVKLQKVDFNTAVGRILKGETEMFSIFFEFVFSSPDHILNNLFSSSKIPVPNFWHYDSKPFDEGLGELWKSEDAEKRTTIAHRLERQVVGDAPAVFLFQAKNELIYAGDLGEVALNGHNVPLLWRVKRQ